MATTLAEHGGEVARALAAAEAACLRRGAQLTELRRQVLQLVLEAGQPIGAYALLDRLRGARPGAAPPTVYRALDFLSYCVIGVSDALVKLAYLLMRRKFGSTSSACN